MGNVGGCNVDFVELLVGHITAQIEFRDFILCLQEVALWPSTEEWAEKPRICNWELRHGKGSQVAAMWPSNLGELQRSQWYSDEHWGSVLMGTLKIDNVYAVQPKDADAYILWWQNYQRWTNVMKE